MSTEEGETTALPRRRKKRESHAKYDESFRHLSSILDDQNDDPVLDMPIRLDVAPDDKDNDRSLMTSGGAAKVHMDIYGRKPAHEELFDERLTALKREIGKIPNDERAALLKALSNNPVLFESSPHSKRLLQSEPFNPKDAAQKLAKYWTKRERLFGERAFSDGVFASPTYEDYLQYYEKCEMTIEDPEMDELMKRIASDYIDAVHQSKVAALDYVLQNADKEDASALREAQEKGALVTNETKLLFLKTEDFIETKAAARMMSYWEMKRLLFGADDFQREITLDDIDTNYRRFFRILPGDDNGRVVAAVFANELERSGWTDDMMCRYYWYVLHAAMESDLCKRNGIVVLVNYETGSKELSQKISVVRSICRTILFDCVPVKWRASHLFLKTSAWWHWVFFSIVSKLSGMVQKKVLVHSGSNEQNRIEMEQYYGIPPDQFPIDLGGDLDLDSTWDMWLEKRRAEGL